MHRIDIDYYLEKNDKKIPPARDLQDLAGEINNFLNTPIGLITFNLTQEIETTKEGVCVKLKYEFCRDIVNKTTYYDTLTEAKKEARLDAIQNLKYYLEKNKYNILDNGKKVIISLIH